MITCKDIKSSVLLFKLSYNLCFYSRSSVPLFSEISFVVYKVISFLFFALQEKILQPSFLSYKELLLLNIQEVTSRLSASSSTTDPTYFRSLMDHMQSPSCTLSDFRRIHMYFMVCTIHLVQLLAFVT